MPWTWAGNGGTFRGRGDSDWMTTPDDAEVPLVPPAANRVDLYACGDPSDPSCSFWSKLVNKVSLQRQGDLPLCRDVCVANFLTFAIPIGEETDFEVLYWGYPWEKVQSDEEFSPSRPWDWCAKTVLTPRFLVHCSNGCQ